MQLEKNIFCRIVLLILRMSFLESIHCQFELSQEDSPQEISKISKIRMKHEWEFVRIFHSKEAAEYIKLEDQFTFYYRNYTQIGGRKQIYRCKNTYHRKITCHASIQLIFNNDSNEVTMWKSKYDHTTMTKSEA